MNEINIINIVDEDSFVEFTAYSIFLIQNINYLLWIQDNFLKTFIIIFDG